MHIFCIAIHIWWKERSIRALVIIIINILSYYYNSIVLSLHFDTIHVNSVHFLKADPRFKLWGRMLGKLRDKWRIGSTKWDSRRAFKNFYITFTINFIKLRKFMLKRDHVEYKKQCRQWNLTWDNGLNMVYFYALLKKGAYSFATVGRSVDQVLSAQHLLTPSLDQYQTWCRGLPSMSRCTLLIFRSHVQRSRSNHSFEPSVLSTL